MGTWGYGAFDNDAAGDLVGGLFRHVELAVERKSDLAASHHYPEARAVGQFIAMAHGTDILGGPALATVLRALVRMRLDAVWLSSFDRPAQLADRLEDEMGHLVVKMRACASCKKDLGKDPNRGLWGLVTLACKSEVPHTRGGRRTKARGARPMRIRLPKKKARAGRRRRS